MKKLFVILTMLTIWLAGCEKKQPAQTSKESLSTNGQSALEFPKFYDKIDDVADVIVSCQIPQGGICRFLNEKNNVDGQEAFMTTYCFAGTGLVKAYQMTGNKEYLDRAKSFIDFWMGYQNTEPDRFGLTGTFYDKYLTKEGEIKNHFYDGSKSLSNKGGFGYDASDADGPTISWTALHYYKVTGDKAYLEKYRDHFKRIAQSIEATLDPQDSLTYCHPNWSIKYLMDVCEVWHYLNALGEIFTVIDEPELAQKYQQLASDSQKSIVSWWNEKEQWYFWYKDTAGKSNESLDWSVWYPDAAEQIWPLLWGVTEPDFNQSQTVWKSFNENIPDWTTNDTEWPAASIVAAKMGDFDKAVVHTENILTKRLGDPDWETNHCYFTIINCCMDFDLEGSAHVVENSFKKNDAGFSVKLTSATDGDSIIKLRLADYPDAEVFLNAKKIEVTQAGLYQTLQVSLKAGEQAELKVDLK